MKNILTKLKALTALAIMSLFVSNAAIASGELRFGHVYEVDTPYHKAALKAAELLAKKTDNRWTMAVFPASQLGEEGALNEALSIGTIDSIYTAVAFLGQSYPPIAISDYPFTMRSYQHFKNYVASDLFKEMADKYKAVSGNTIAAMAYYGARHVTANKPILKPEDMKGLKIRTPNAPAFQMFPKATGANPTPLAFSEVYLALQQGVVDAQENPLPTIKFKKFYEVQSDISLTSHITNSLAMIVSPFTLKKMGDDAPKLLEALQEASEEVSDEVRQSEQDLVKWFREQNINVHEVDRQPFIDIVKPLLTADDTPWSADIYQRLQAIED